MLVMNSADTHRRSKSTQKQMIDFAAVTASLVCMPLTRENRNMWPRATVLKIENTGKIERTDCYRETLHG